MNLQRSPIHVAVFKGPTSNGRKGRGREGEEKEREKMGRKRGKEGQSRGRMGTFLDHLD